MIRQVDAVSSWWVRGESDIEAPPLRRERFTYVLSCTITKTWAHHSSLLASDDGEAVCYLCLDGGVDESSGQPLRRDCACRGTDAGFVHLSCLTK
jgi:hypothetical protein